MKQFTVRFRASLLALSLLLSLAACGDKNTAAVMHLRRTEGTVSVSDGGGKDVPVMENLGLYSGYGVGTRPASYAWIDLDDVKLAKLDQNSEIAIQREGKALDIELKSGSLFFNVTKPLEDDEAMNIRTSTMLVGIRGTCGWVEERDGLSRVYLLEGKVECTAGSRTVQINAGEMAELRADGEFLVDVFPAGAVPDFVRDDLSPDIGGGAGGFGGMDDPPGPDGSDAPEASDPGSGDEPANYEPDNADDLLEALRSAKNGDVITLAGDIQAKVSPVDLVIPGGSEDDPVVLDLNGHTLTMQVSLTENVRVSGALRIRDGSGTGGGVLTSGRPVVIEDSAYLFLDSGTINGTGNATLSLSNSTFVMSGGTVSGGRNFVIGVLGGAAFTMTGGAIEGSNAPKAVYVTASTFTMDGGTIHDTYAAVDLTDSTFLMNGGTISGAEVNSVAVIPLSNSTFLMNGGTLNSVSNYAVSALNASAFTINGGTVSCEQHNAVHLRQGTAFTITGGEVVSSGSTTINCPDGGVKLEFTGGTLTNSGSGYYYVLYIRDSEPDLILGNTVIRSKRNSFFEYYDVSIKTWWPDGCASTETPDAEGYYYLIKG